MKFLIDDADITKIREIYEYYPVDGVTTNPSILAKAGGSPQEVLRENPVALSEKKQTFTCR